MRLLTPPTLTSASRALLCALAIAGAGLLTPAQAQSLDLSTMTDSQKAAFREAVREALMSDPAMIEEAQNALEKQRYLTALDKLKSIGDTDKYVFKTTPEGADLTLIELTDYDCPYCRKSQPEIAELLERDPKIEHIVVALPYIRGDVTERIVLAAKLQGDQDKVIALHRALMAFNGNLTEDALRKIVDEIGLDFDRIFNDMGAPEVEAELNYSLDVARGLQIGGTPAFLLGDKLLNGLREADEMVAVAAAERAKN